MPTGRRYQIDPELGVPDRYPSALSNDLTASDNIQVAPPEILRTLHEIGADTGPVLAGMSVLLLGAMVLEAAGRSRDTLSGTCAGPDQSGRR